MNTTTPKAEVVFNEEEWGQIGAALLGETPSRPCFILDAGKNSNVHVSMISRTVPPSLGFGIHQKTPEQSELRIFYSRILPSRRRGEVHLQAPDQCRRGLCRNPQTR